MAFLDFSGLSHFLDKLKTIFALDSNVVHTTGNENITGEKTLNDNIFLKNTSIDHTSLPSADKYRGIYFTDTNNITLSRILFYKNANGISGLSLGVKAHNTNDYIAGLNFNITQNGDMTVITQTPPSVSDDSTKIATTAWVRDATGDFACNAATATKLAIPRNLTVDLSSTTAVTFDGSANQNAIPISNILPVANGGTGINGTITPETASDFNDYTTPGYYHLRYNGDVVNCPDPKPLASSAYRDCFLYVIAIAPASDVSGYTRVYQFYYKGANLNENTYAVYMRVKASIWYPWRNVSVGTNGYNTTAIYTSTLAQDTAYTSSSPWNINIVTLGNYKSIVSYIESPAASKAMTLYYKITFSDNNTKIVPISNGLNTSARYTTMYCENRNGFIYTHLQVGSGENSTCAHYSAPKPVIISPYSTISSIDIYSTTSNSQFPSGTKITIYGLTL